MSKLEEMSPQEFVEHLYINREYTEDTMDEVLTWFEVNTGKGIADDLADIGFDTGTRGLKRQGIEGLTEALLSMDTTKTNLDITYSIMLNLWWMGSKISKQDYDAIHSKFIKDATEKKDEKYAKRLLGHLTHKSTNE